MRRRPPPPPVLPPAAWQSSPPSLSHVSGSVAYAATLPPITHRCLLRGSGAEQRAERSGVCDVHDQTLGNLLRYALQTDPRVEQTAFTKPRPLVDSVYLVVQLHPTTTTTTAVDDLALYEVLVHAVDQRLAQLDDLAVQWQCEVSLPPATIPC